MAAEDRKSLSSADSAEQSWLGMVTNQNEKTVFLKRGGERESECYEDKLINSQMTMKY